MRAQEILLNKNLEELEKIKENLIIKDKEIDDKYSSLKQDILEKSQAIINVIDQVVSSNYYMYCNRGVFGAAIFDLDSMKFETDMAFNMPSPEILKVCRLNKEQCTRSIVNKKHGLDYSTCPARHAREKVNFYPISRDNNYIWIEGGAILIDNQFKYWDIETLQDQTYPCIRCLNYSSLESVKILAALNKRNGEWGVSFHDVDNHAELLLIRTTLSQMVN